MSETETIQQFAADLVRRVHVRAREDVHHAVGLALADARDKIRAKLGDYGPLPPEWARVAETADKIVEECARRLTAARPSTIRERLAAGGDP